MLWRDKIMEKPFQHHRYLWENSLKQISDYIEIMEKKLEYLKKEIEGYSLNESYDTYIAKKYVKNLEQKIIELENKLNTGGIETYLAKKCVKRLEQKIIELESKLNTRGIK